MERALADAKLTTKMLCLLNILPTDAGIGSHDTDIHRPYCRCEDVGSL